MSGDNQQIVESVGLDVSVAKENVRGGVLPGGKSEFVKALQQQGTLNNNTTTHYKTYTPKLHYTTLYTMRLLRYTIHNTQHNITLLYLHYTTIPHYNTILIIIYIN